MIGRIDRARTLLDLVGGLAGVTSPNNSDEVGAVLMFDSRGDLDPHEQRTLSTVFAWAFDRESVPLLRDDFALAVDNMSAGQSTAPAVLALVVSGAGNDVDAEIRASLEAKLNAALAGSGHDLGSLLSTPDYVAFTAPYWLVVTAGLARRVPPVPAVPRRRRAWRQPAAEPVTEQYCDALRERRGARRIVRHLLEHRMIDPVSGVAVSSVLAWSLLEQPVESDAPEAAALLDQLRTHGLVAAEVDAWMRRDP